MLASKVNGAWNLHVLTRELTLDFFVLFSSASALIGSQGQGNYAAANAFLDALAWYRRLDGRPALSIDWGPWAEAGMAASHAAGLGDRLKAFGVELIPAGEGLIALERLMEADSAQQAVLHADWSIFGQRLGGMAGPSLTGDLVRQAGDAA